MPIMQDIKMHVSGRFAIQVEKIINVETNFYVADMWTLSKTKLKFDNKRKETVLNFFWINETELAVVDKWYGSIHQLIYEINLKDCTATRVDWRVLPDRIITGTSMETKEILINGMFYSIFLTKINQYNHNEFVLIRWLDGKEYEMSVQGPIMVAQYHSKKNRNFSQLFNSRLKITLDEQPGNELNCMDLEKYQITTERININQSTEGYSATQLMGVNLYHLADSRTFGFEIQLIGTHLFTKPSCSIVQAFDLLSNGESNGRYVSGSHVMEIGERKIFFSSQEDRLVITGSLKKPSESNLKSLEELARSHALQRVDLSQSSAYLRFIFPYNRYIPYKKIVSK